MRRRVLLLPALAVLLGLGVGGVAGAVGGERQVTIPMPSNEMWMSEAFTPEVLSKTEPTPVSLSIGAEIKDLTYGHPPALRELAMEFDESIAIDTDGIPACPRGNLGEEGETLVALKACRTSLIGEGQATVQVDYPETEPVNVHSRLLAFNGGERDRETTLLIHAYFPDPIASAIVVPVKIAKHRSGYFGTRAVARIPQIADGYGSLTKFDLVTFKSVEIDGGRLHPVRATCPAGKLRVLNDGNFEDGTEFQIRLVRVCTGRS